MVRNDHGLWNVDALLMHLILFFKKNWALPGLFFSLFLSFQNTVDSTQMFDINNFLSMTGFVPRTSGIESDRSTN